jgi:hypothetical protein
MDRLETRLFDAFEKMVQHDLEANSGSRKQTFHQVNDDFATKVGFKPFKSYQSYRNARCRNRKK